jgi:hypothetical protein
MQPGDYIALLSLIFMVLATGISIIAAWVLMGARIRSMESSIKDTILPSLLGHTEQFRAVDQALAALRQETHLLHDWRDDARRRLDEQGRALEAIIKLEAEFRAFRDQVGPALNLVARAIART